MPDRIEWALRPLINTGSSAFISTENERTSESDAIKEFLDLSNCTDASDVDAQGDLSRMNTRGSDQPATFEQFALDEDLSSTSRDASVSSTHVLSSPEHSPSLSPKPPLRSDTVYHDISGISPPLVVASYECRHAQCGARLGSTDAYSKHFRIKHPAKPYRCGLLGCDKSFPDERSRRRHWDTRKHRTNNTPVYTCHCSASRPRWDKFKDHLRCCTVDQTAVSTYTCCCGKAFQHITGLEAHKLASHTDKPGRPPKRREIPGKESL